MSAHVNRITERVIGAAIAVHRVLGPGLLESSYKTCLARELEEQGLRFEREVPVPVVYKDVRLDCGYRMDLLVEGRVVVELKAVAGIEPVHTAQLLTYLRLAKVPAGLLINFNVPVLKSGVRRVVNDRAIPRPSRTLAVAPQPGGKQQHPRRHTSG